MTHPGPGVCVWGTVENLATFLKKQEETPTAGKQWQPCLEDPITDTRT